MMMRDNLFVTIVSKELNENSELLIRYAFSDDIHSVIANDKYNSMNERENVIVHCRQDMKKDEKKLVNLRLYNLNFTSSKTILNEMKTPGMHHIVIDKNELLEDFYYVKLNIGSYIFIHKAKT